MPILAPVMSEPSGPPVADRATLSTRVEALMPRDQRRIWRRLNSVPSEKLETEVAAAEERIARRAAAVPKVTYPAELPITSRRDEIIAAIRDHQVVIVAGETGSGKTTQLPKMCLELGRGVRGTIGHTQPRRIAARTVADRIAEELGVPVGDAVGMKMRFTDHVRDTTLVKLMTDGILLAELQGDRNLLQYDTLIIDEAHERSLNIDFILGYLKQLLPRRPDLKIIITSATIDPERFARHFDGAPVIEVSGRTYPVEVRYRPVGEDGDGDQIQAICDAVEELAGEGPGDVLVFLSGEREIRDTADALRKAKLRHTEVLPLYARLSTAEQHRVFEPHTGRRIVLATNVAETSLTVPGIRYVVDPGTARISRYSHRTKVQRLPIEPISRASANQRAGRCGRTSDGICIRLYGEDDFAARSEFTDPEILRTNLASVILQMTAIGLGDVAAFPFLDPPDRRNIADGMQLLQELGALDGPRLTGLGRKLAQLPIDPRLGRMVLAAAELGCLREVLIIASALSIQDPRERPADNQPAADAMHARFADETSDFLAYLNLWRYLREQQKALSSSAFRRLCKAEFLHFLRVREWQDLHGQLRQVATSLGAARNETPGEPDQIHQALLAGLLSHIGLKDQDTREYAGARGARFAVFPGSALFKKPPRWVMAAELVETARLWGRINAKIEPEWAEKLAGHLVRRSYSEPHWSRGRGAVLAYEKVTLYGVPIVTQRLVSFGRIDPRLSRELFIRRALVEGDWDTRHAFFAANRALLDEVADLEHRVRRRDILVDDETLYAFYDERVPDDVVSARHFDAWWKRARGATPDLLSFTTDLVVNPAAGTVRPQDYPDAWPYGDLALRLTYQFEPGTQADGVTVHIPLPVLGRVPAAGFDWQVPGLRLELVTALLRALPKALRRSVVPVPDWAAYLLASVSPDSGPLLDALETALRRLAGVVVARADWDLAKVPDYLKVTFRVVDEHGATLGEGKDLAALQRGLAPRVAATVAAVADGLARDGLRTWDFDALPRLITQERAGFTVSAYPSLVDRGDSVSIRALDSEAEQSRAMWRGTRRLLLLNLPQPATLVAGRLTNSAKLLLLRNPHRNVPDLLADCAACAVDQLIADAGGPAWDRAAFTALRARVAADLVPTTLDVIGWVQRILGAAYGIEQRLAALPSPALARSVADIRAHLDGLVHRGFVTETGWAHLPDVPRYLRALDRRLEKLPQNPARDLEQTDRIAELLDEYAQLRAELPPSAELDAIRWMLEELRVNYFAQAIGTPYPISDKRIRRAMDDLFP